jgi:hypothetical protein
MTSGYLSDSISLCSCINKRVEAHSVRGIDFLQGLLTSSLTRNIYCDNNKNTHIFITSSVTLGFQLNEAT